MLHHYLLLGQCGTGAKTCSANAACWDSSAVDSVCVCKPGYTIPSDNQCQSKRQQVQNGIWKASYLETDFTVNDVIDLVILLSMA